MRVASLFRSAALVLIGAGALLVAGCQDEAKTAPPPTLPAQAAPAPDKNASQPAAAPAAAGSSASGAKMPKVGEPQ